VEKAVNELINMLLDVEIPSKEESGKESLDSKSESSGKR
jgi:hypothetical protein